MIVHLSVVRRGGLQLGRRGKERYDHHDKHLNAIEPEKLIGIFGTGLHFTTRVLELHFWRGDSNPYSGPLHLQYSRKASCGGNN